MRIRKFQLIILAILSSFLTAKQQEISSIKFSGNKFITTEELQNWMPLTETSFFEKSIYNSRSLKLTVIQLKHFYSSKGFINAKINPNVEIIDDLVDIEFVINEGNQFHIKKIEYFGNRIFTNEEIEQILNVKANDVFNPLHITKKLKALIRNYLEAGKFYISIMDELIEENNKVIIRVNIHEGNTYYFGDTTIEGLEKLNPKTVYRESIINRGDLYNISKIEETQTRIFSSLLFSSVEIIPKDQNKLNDTVNLVIKVKEMNDRDIRGEIGFGQTESPLGENSPPLTSIELNSTIQSGFFLNTPNKLTLKIDLGMTIDENISLMENKLFPKRNFSIGYRTPWLLGLRIPLNLKIFDYYVEEDNDYRHRQGIESSFLYRKSDRNQLLGSLIFESVNLVGGNTENQKELERKIRITHQRHSLDNLISPRKGSFFGLYSTLRGTFLGGNTHYLLSDIEFKNFRNIFNSIVVGFRIKTGYLKILNDTNEESITDFFFLGGSTSLRGWDKADDLNYNNNALFRGLTNFEVRYPIYKNFGGEIFFDAGILGRNKSDINYSNLYWDVGYGFTFNTALGPARLDVAYPYGQHNFNTSISLLYSF